MKTSMSRGNGVRVRLREWGAVSAAILLAGVVGLPAAGASGSSGFSMLVSSDQLGWNEGLAVGANGTVFSANFFNGTVQEYSPATGALVTIAQVGEANAKGLALDARGNLYITAQGYQDVLYQESAATLAAGGVAIPGAGLTEVTSWTSGGAGGIALDGSGNLFVAAGDGVLAVPAATLTDPGSWPVTPTTIVPAADGLANVADVAISPSGDLAIANGEQTSSGTVDLVAAGSVSSALLGAPVPSSGVLAVATPASTGVVSPVGVAFDGAGDLIVVDAGAGSVLEVPAAQVIRARDGSGAVGASSLVVLGSSLPMGSDDQLNGVAVEESGAVLLATGAQVLPTGAILISPAGTVANSFGSPLRLSVSAHVVGQGRRAAQEVAATWTGGGPGPWSCTLLYGFVDPAPFHVTTSDATCAFAGLALGRVFGIEVRTLAMGQGAEAFATPARFTITCVYRGRVLHRTGVDPTCPPRWHQRG